MVCAISVEGIIGNNHMKLFYIRTSSLEVVILRFSIFSSGGHFFQKS